MTAGNQDLMKKQTLLSWIQNMKTTQKLSKTKVVEIRVNKEPQKQTSKERFCQSLNVVQIHSGEINERCWCEAAARRKTGETQSHRLWPSGKSVRNSVVRQFEITLENHRTKSCWLLMRGIFWLVLKTSLIVWGASVSIEWKNYISTEAPSLLKDISRFLEQQMLPLYFFLDKAEKSSSDKAAA